MIDLYKRSYKKELLDDPSIPFADIKQNMKELNVVNTWLGGHQISITGLEDILKKFPKKENITICEIGCGGGDNLNAINKWCRQKGINALFIGIDIKPECIAFAEEQYPSLNAKWILSDYKLTLFDKQPDIIFSSLFCHHFTDEEIISMLGWMKKNASMGFFINDLHRHSVAYHSIKMITAFVSKSYLVKNDAPLSVARGFKLSEWKELMKEANIVRYSISWKWAFRHLIVYISE